MYFLMQMACVESTIPCGRGYYSSTSVSGTDYAQLLTTGGSLCIPCPDLCSDCVGASKCTGCKYALFTAAGSFECIQNCTMGDSGCSVCHSQCNGCSGPTSRDCIECHNANISDVNGPICVPTCTAVNTYLALVDNEYLCIPCDANCDKCTGPGSNSCIDCAFYNASTVSDSNVCVTVCPDGFYGDDNDGYCRSCHEECITCTSQYSVNCTACQNDEIVLSNGSKQCIPKCSFAHKYQTESAKCEIQWSVSSMHRLLIIYLLYIAIFNTPEQGSYTYFIHPLGLTLLL